MNWKKCLLVKLIRRYHHWGNVHHYRFQIEDHLFLRHYKWWSRIYEKYGLSKFHRLGMYDLVSDIIISRASTCSGFKEMDTSDITDMRKRPEEFYDFYVAFMDHLLSDDNLLKIYDL